MRIYTRHEWKGLTNEERKDILRDRMIDGDEVWDAPDGSIAFATYSEMEERAQKTGDENWVECSEAAYASVREGVTIPVGPFISKRTGKEYQMVEVWVPPVGTVGNKDGDFIIVGQGDDGIEFEITRDEWLSNYEVVT